MIRKGKLPGEVISRLRAEYGSDIFEIRSTLLLPVRAC